MHRHGVLLRARISLTAPSAEIHCVGRCYQAPAHLEEGEFPVPWRVLGAESIVFKEMGLISHRSALALRNP